MASAPYCGFRQAKWKDDDDVVVSSPCLQLFAYTVRPPHSVYIPNLYFLTCYFKSGKLLYRYLAHAYKVLPCLWAESRLFCDLSVYTE